MNTTNVTPTGTTKDEYFTISQQNERERIKYFFNNHLRYKNCSSLILTSTEDFSPFDAQMITACTTNDNIKHHTVTIEYKHRDISIKTYSDCIIEYTKYHNLLPFHQAGQTILFIVEYQEAFAIWNLSTMYEAEKHIDPTHFFYFQNCTASMSDYQHGGKKKLVRALQFRDCYMMVQK